MTSWSAGTSHFSANSYEHFQMKGRMIHWDRVVWEPWSLPKHCFVLWIAVLSKLRTKDRLHFILTDTSCVFYSQDQESHSHLFFKCPWTSNLWGNIVWWLHIHRRMSSLPSAIRGLFPKKVKIVSRMWRVSLAISVYLIWEERSKRLFDSSSSSVERVFQWFQVLFFTVFHSHERDHFAIDVGLWMVRL